MDYFEMILIHPHLGNICPRIVLTKGLEKEVLEWFEDILKEYRPKDPNYNVIPLLRKITKDEYDLELANLTDVEVYQNGRRIE